MQDAQAEEVRFLSGSEADSGVASLDGGAGGDGGWWWG